MLKIKKVNKFICLIGAIIILSGCAIKPPVAHDSYCDVMQGHMTSLPPADWLNIKNKYPQLAIESLYYRQRYVTLCIEK